MSEWLKEHAWKSNPAARADAYEIPPRHFRINDFRNSDARRHVLVNQGVHPGFQGVCDTVLTQTRSSLARSVDVDSGIYSYIVAAISISATSLHVGFDGTFLPWLR